MNLDELYARPGFLLRRAHQIAVAIFLQECRRVRLTPPQHGVLIAVQRLPGIAQAQVARVLGFDRATVGQVVEGLLKRDLLRRKASPDHRRAASLTVSPAGARLMKRASGVLHATSERLLAPLNPAERALFLDMLTRLTSGLNSASRTPVGAHHRRGAPKPRPSRGGKPG